MTDISEKDEAKISKKRRGSKSRGTTEKTLEKEGSTVSKKSEGRSSSKSSNKSERRSSKGGSGKQDKEGSRSSKKEPKAGTSGVSRKLSRLMKKQSKESAPAPSCAEPPPTANAGDLITVKARLVGAAALIFIGCFVAVLGFLAKLMMKQTATDNLPCVSQECQEVVAMTERLLDQDVRPCDDFYRHVCGHWIKNVTHPSSFMVDAERNFSLARHQALMRNYGTGSEHVLLNASAAFYQSCLAFLGNKVDAKAATEELFKELNITVSEWQAQADPKWFFAKVIHLSLVHRFHTLLSIGILARENATMTILVERTKPLYALAKPGNDAALATYLRELLMTISKKLADDKIIEEVLKLDRSRPNETLDLDEIKKVGLEPTACPEFSSALWTETVGRYMGINGSRFARVMNYDSVCDDLENVLVSTKSKARPLYLLLIVSTDVLRYDFPLHAGRAEHVVRELCYRAIAEAFGVLWQPLMSRFLQVSESVEQQVDHYVGYAKAYMNKLVHTRTWMGEADRNATLAKIAKMRVARFHGGVMAKRDVDCFGKKSVTSAGFVSNMVRLRTVQDVKNCTFIAPNRTEGRIRLKLLDTTLAMDRDALTVVLPHFFAVPPMFYRQVNDDEFINIAVTGTQLARRLFSLIDRTSVDTPPSTGAENVTRLARGWSFGTLANFSAIQRCYERVTKFKGFHEPLTDAQFDEVFNVMDAVRMGHAGKNEFEPELVAKNKHRVRASDAMFFKRVCLSLCTHRDAPPNANVPGFATAYASCLFAVASLPQFAQAFRCDSSDIMWRINRCCVD